MTARRRIGIAVGVLLLVLVFFWVFVVDWIVEREIESRGTEAVGAIVDLGAADVSAFPPKLELVGLAVTNPFSPMRNAVEVGRIEGVLDTAALWSGRAIIDRLDVEGVRFDTERAASGAVGDGPPPPPPTPEAALPSLEIPSVSEILATEELRSLAVIRALEGDLRSADEAWKARLAALPDEKTFAAYEERFRNVTQGDPVQTAARVDALRSDVQKDVQALQTAGKDLKRELATLQQRVADAQKAPLEDVARLRERYALSPEGVSNLTARLLGQPVAEIVDQAIAWNERLQALVAGGDAPAEPSETPDFLIRLANVSAEVLGGEVRGAIENITANQPAFGKPMTFAFTGDAVPGVSKLTLDGVVDRVDPQRPSDALSLELAGYDASGTSLSGSPAWPIAIARGTADGSAKLALGAGDALDASARLHVAGVRLDAPFASKSAVATAVADAVKTVTEMELRVSATGTTSDYRLKIESNLDRVLSGAVRGLLQREGERLAQRLREEVLARTSGPLDAVLREQRELLDVASLIGRRTEAGEELLTLKPAGLQDALKKLKLF